ncbi:hypothetical protein T08_10727 [Trichinella sp. T8]|nr:hypothetical protein T08_10727 [Trichinella sp. T8]
MQSESLSLDNVQQARYYFHSELCKHDTHAISSNYETTGRTRMILQSREHFHRTEKEKSNKGTWKLVIRKQNDREPLLSDTLFPYSLNYSKWNSEESYSYVWPFWDKSHAHFNHIFEIARLKLIFCKNYNQAK